MMLFSPLWGVVDPTLQRQPPPEYGLIAQTRHAKSWRRNGDREANH